MAIRDITPHSTEVSSPMTHDRLTPFDPFQRSPSEAAVASHSTEPTMQVHKLQTTRRDPVQTLGSSIPELIRLYDETEEPILDATEAADKVRWEARSRYPEIPDSIKMDIGDPAPLYIPIDPANIERRRARLVSSGRRSEAEAARWAEETERTRCEYKAACDAMLAATEWPALDRRVRELAEAQTQIEQRILAARPRSLADLLAKLRFAARFDDYLEEDAEGLGPQLVGSAIRDLERMVEGAS
jgi:hypothetical protein